MVLHNEFYGHYDRMPQAASAPAQTAAPKKKYKLNFKFDFTKVNFKKKAAKKVCVFLCC